MTLVLAFLQKDFILLASDRRHTRGDSSANYRYDCDTKVHRIMDGSGLFSFAGHDFCEQIFYRAKDSRLLEGRDLRSTSEAVSRLAAEQYKVAFPDCAAGGPSVEFLVAGFAGEREPRVATSYWLRSPGFYPKCAVFPHRKFEVIGRSAHGALYALHRFGSRDLTIDQASRVAGFVLAEIYECDTTVGGLPQFWLLRPGSQAEPVGPARVQGLLDEARRVGAELGEMLLVRSSDAPV